MKNIELLDCTLRDGCYIVNAEFGTPVIKGIIKKLQDAGTEIIECGWLKDTPHKEGTAFYHLPSDLEPYLIDRKKDVTYVAMIDWDRYNLDNLPVCDGKSINAIRVVFPHGKHKEGIEIGKKIKRKGYDVYFQAANTLAYSDDDLIALANDINESEPVCLSVVDTFGAMYEEDLDHILGILNKYLDPKIKIGFHSHNNQQLSFSLSAHFVKKTLEYNRKVIVDSSLCGMGRGAGNTTTELIVSYLNRKCNRNYDMNAILDAIDLYMPYFIEKYKWGYSTPYFIAGLYCCHVNNIAYLQNNHRTNARDMYNIIEHLSPEDRRKYDYNLLEEKYIENQNRTIDDTDAMDFLKKVFEDKEILILAPGKSIVEYEKDIKHYIDSHHPVVIAVNAIIPLYTADYLFLISNARYDYAKSAYPQQFRETTKILLSNIKTQSDENEIIVNFSNVNKMGWKYFDNAVVDCLRLLDRLHVKKISLAGFDGFKNKYNESYADQFLPTLNTKNTWEEINSEISAIYQDFKLTKEYIEEIKFITESIFDI